MSQSVQAPKTSTLAIIALVMSVLFFPVGLVLAIVALVRISSSRGALGGQAIAIIALVISLLVVPFCGGIVAAIAIPNFVKFQCRAKQSEAKVNLASARTAQEAHFAATGAYANTLEEAGFTPGRTLRYQYVVVSAAAGALHLEAQGQGDMAGDVWRLAGDGPAENVANVCQR